jgi:NADPH:quinone reductase-like Zn-dependent oxidoreductase
VAASPRSLDTAHVAAIPHVTLTAWQALFVQADLTSGQTVLIHGAAGGVGHAAVQLAQWKGARVIGTASTNIDFLNELHVDQAINYATTPFEEVVESVDVVLDLIGGDYQERSCKVLKPNGMLVSTIQAPSEEMAAAYGVRQSMVYTTPPIGETLAKVADLADAGHFKPHISAVLPLEEVAKAHEKLEGQHTRGKIVLEVAPFTH